MARSSSVMSQEGVDVAWIGDVPISVAQDGSCTVDIIVTAARAPGVCNVPGKH